MKRIQRCNVEHIVSATKFGPGTPGHPNQTPGKAHYRIVGALDIDGKGTKHPLQFLDPFVFWDESLNPAGQAGLGGGGHPHSGLAAITYLSPDSASGIPTEKGAISPWDNHGGAAPDHNAGGLYIINAAKGIVHDERNITPEGTMHQLQLWIDPGMGKKPLPEREAASYQLKSPSDIPLVKLGADGSHCRVMIGEQFGAKSPIEAPIPVLYLHLKLACGASTTVTVPGGFQGLVYVLSGDAKVGDLTDLGTRDAGILSPSDPETGSELTITNSTPENELQIIVAAGQPQYSGALYKLLGHGGALFAASEEQVRESMKEYEANPETFGKASL